MHSSLRSWIFAFGSLGALAACTITGSDGRADGPAQSTAPTLGDDGGEPAPACTQNADCASGLCQGDRCAPTAGGGDAGGDGGDAGPPPKPCGAASGVTCELGRACAASADCASSLCGTAGPNKGKCISAKSCTGGPGANQACAGNEDCCASIAVPGGAYTNRDNSGLPSAAAVAPFKLDKFEVTVGRVRAFFQAFQGNIRGNPPAAGAGAHPLIPGSGWRDSWNVRLPGSWAEVDARLVNECAVGGNNAAWGAATWTEQPGPNEDKPINCLDWYTLFAFAVWDGGRLPTDAEWSYVAYGGTEDRLFPWGSDPAAFATHKDVLATSFQAPGETYGHYTEGSELRAIDDGPLHIARVGVKTGRSKWGHADMGGNVIELVLDVARPIPAACDNCANVAFPDPPQGPPVQPLRWQPLDEAGNPPAGGDDFADARAVQDGKRLARGGSWQGEFEGHWLANQKNRHWYPLWRTYSALGMRLARDL